MAVKNIFEKILLAIFAVCWLAAPVFAQKKQIRVAAAADLQTVMPEIAKAYETRSGTSVEVVYGSSGNFYAQIQNGAPLDVFFSADSEYPGKLEVRICRARICRHLWLGPDCVVDARERKL